MFYKRFIVNYYFPMGHLSEYFCPWQGKGIPGIKANLILKKPYFAMAGVAQWIER